jgi:sugar transferase EpsL
MDSKNKNHPMTYRTLDILLGVPALIICLPIMVVIGSLVRIKMGKGVLFRQSRPGLFGKAFVMLKFRTMKNSLDEALDLSDSERITKLGRFLRSTSLDELPELINVVKGDMSLVGPRPLLMRYLNRYTPEQRRRHDVKPGITGWAQVNGRNALTWDEKFALDLWYVDHQSVSLNLKIISMTFSKIFKREGISHPGEATMNEFMGA